jgi:NAD(P)H dehydrogenase (quinone)
MTVSVILAHPDPASLNHAVARAAADELAAGGHEVNFHDLCAEMFDPALSAPEIAEGAALPKAIDKHCRELAGADGIIVVHPDWWGQPPAVLKGWIDRVFRPGVAYRFWEGDGGEGVPEGLLKARAALVFNTSNTTSRREKKAFGDPLETLWKNCVFGLCGVKEFYRRTFSVVVTSTREERAQWLAEVRETVRSYFPKRK